MKNICIAVFSLLVFTGVIKKPDETKADPIMVLMPNLELDEKIMDLNRSKNYDACQNVERADLVIQLKNLPPLKNKAAN